ncbi:hypothetical protein PILCRDRAFT_813444 [Piloderma croceum F 1598]|uniref:Cytochrome c oxidase assembly protein COX20, mitochondrial n=1 Tax=Piloderma croceum (strain F 1598) TaxID=765440 RepID=A0A0C3BSJ8_PILCF|nr:hypothetical protein PILCRDRAFT_813444 [Piloderma croceum F 1598]
MSQPSSNQPKEIPPPDNRSIRTRFLQFRSNPCTTESLLSAGLAGAGVGLIRSFSGGTQIGRIWGGATFCVMAVWSRWLCEYRENVDNMYINMPKDMSKKNEEGTTAATDRAS